MRRTIPLALAACLLGPAPAWAQDARPPAPKPPSKDFPLLKQSAPPAPTGSFSATCQTGAGYCGVAGSAPIPPGTACSCGADAGQTQ